MYALAVFNCNNCTRYVENQKVSLYYGAYASKLSTENEKALAEKFRALSGFEEKVENRRLIAENQSEDVLFASQPPTAARAASNGETESALLAAFVARGNLIFDMSHKTAVLPLTQIVAFLQTYAIQTNIRIRKDKSFPWFTITFIGIVRVRTWLWGRSLKVTKW